MRINHNIAALNTYNQLQNNNKVQQQSLEKLSSGLRINSAADDAAGLAISEKMRGQIQGLEKAKKNAQDGISMIQTAEGSLNESHSILQRMRELAVQSANDTNTEADRAEIQEEANELAEELKRIGNTTEFNTKKLLNGDFKGTFHIGANEDQSIELDINDMRADALGVAGNQGAGYEITSTDANTQGAVEANTEYDVVEFEEKITLSDGADTNSIDAKYGFEDSEGNIVAVSDENGKDYFTIANGEAKPEDELADANLADDPGTASNAAQFDDPVIRGTVTSDDNGTSFTGTTTIEDTELESGTYTITDLTQDATKDYGAYEVGLKDSSGNVVALADDGSDSDSEIGSSDLAYSGQIDWVNPEDVESTLLTTNHGDTTSGTFDAGDEIEVSGEGIDVSTQSAANSAISTIDDAIEQVSSERSKLGAYQNRLEHTINNLGTAAENLTSAESRIRDVDYAEAA